MVSNKDALNLARKLKYRKPLTPIEKIILHHHGWLKLNKKGFTLSPLAKKKIRILNI